MGHQDFGWGGSDAPEIIKNRFIPASGARDQLECRQHSRLAFCPALCKWGGLCSRTVMQQRQQNKRATLRSGGLWTVFAEDQGCLPAVGVSSRSPSGSLLSILPVDSVCPRPPLPDQATCPLCLPLTATRLAGRHCLSAERAREWSEPRPTRLRTDAQPRLFQQPSRALGPRDLAGESTTLIPTRSRSCRSLDWS